MVGYPYMNSNNPLEEEKDENSPRLNQLVSNMIDTNSDDADPRIDIYKLAHEG